LVLAELAVAAFLIMVLIQLLPLQVPFQILPQWVVVQQTKMVVLAVAVLGLLVVNLSRELVLLVKVIKVALLLIVAVMEEAVLAAAVLGQLVGLIADLLAELVVMV
jgi:hypothetical protein